MILTTAENAITNSGEVSRTKDLARHRMTHPPPCTKIATTAKHVTAASWNIYASTHTTRPASHTTIATTANYATATPGNDYGDDSVNLYDNPHLSPQRSQRRQSMPPPLQGAFMVTTALTG
ncbi:glycoside hydrolase family 15 protein [Tulasnella calospora MUT 4182]|uniref:Glycoside hydrolase family 15 protein n=1 Tax=Tulasnella calospora MUT 4182 TaxID=1051891 RepID=A0A0C3L4N4_9AGAM|nr:glycoside hydrolase family 15 protein [Tulasnella calospora MUT 4182]